MNPPPKKEPVRRKSRDFRGVDYFAAREERVGCIQQGKEQDMGMRKKEKKKETSSASS
jgi:hypothetical protein